MRTHITYDNKTFNYDKDITFCTLSYTLNLSSIKNINTILSFDFIRNFINRNRKRYGLQECWFDTNTYKFRVTASVKPCDEDTYDYELGKKLALTKAQINAFSNVNDFIGDIENCFYKNFNEGLWDMQYRLLVTEMDCRAHFDCIGESLENMEEY